MHSTLRNLLFYIAILAWGACISPAQQTADSNDAFNDISSLPAPQLKLKEPAIKAVPAIR